jgi:hypothetical protein
MLLRPGNAGSNTFTDHKEVLAAALRQVPARFRRKVLIRVDGAGASHELIAHLLSLSSPQRTVLFTCGWMITAADEDAIRQIPADAWKPGTAQDGEVEQDKDAAEITGLMSRAGNWPEGLRRTRARPPHAAAPPELSRGIPRPQCRSAGDAGRPTRAGPVPPGPPWGQARGRRVSPQRRGLRRGAGPCSPTAAACH